MRVSVFGLGYVGTVTAGCLSSNGHTVTGVDVSAQKVQLINSGRSPVVEPGLGPMIESAAARGSLSATLDYSDAVSSTDVSMICVGTPSAANGSMDTEALISVCTQIGESIQQKTEPHIVVIRSTVLPGTLRSAIIPAIEGSSRKKAGKDFSIALNPEFLREGSAIADFRNPPKTVVGVDEVDVGEHLLTLYDGLPGKKVVTTPEVAEYVKYVDNPWHAIKVAFANEIASLCDASGVDSRAVFEIFLEDRKLNISTAYLRPGFAFGGSCLPKDVRAVRFLARSLKVKVPLLDQVLVSNAAHIERTVERILSLGARRIGVLGCSFKEGTDDIRESPFVRLIERLVFQGCSVRVFDTNVRIADIVGRNLQYLHSFAPDLGSLLVNSASAAIEGAEIVILTANAPEYLGGLRELSSEQIFLNLTHADLDEGTETARGS